jgi:hypothetical protein
MALPYFVAAGAGQAHLFRRARRKAATFALLDEWVLGAKRMERDEALAELARRYFTSHDSATLRDFAWWSGLLLTSIVDIFDVPAAMGCQPGAAMPRQ